MAKYYYKSYTNLGRFKKFAGGILIGFGLLTFLYFFFPIVSWHIYFSTVSSSDLETPIPFSLVVGRSLVLSGLLSSGVAAFATNFEDARNWYPGVTLEGRVGSPATYALSIPRLSIDEAMVSTVDYDLSKHLVHYVGTALPGEKGTAVILGHSTLPQLFDKDNYRTIFATLHKLKTGDEFYVKINGASYKYKIFSIFITDASSTNIFSQSYDSSYVTLVTCTPPGTVWKRLIIKGRLESMN